MPPANLTVKSAPVTITAFVGPSRPSRNVRTSMPANIPWVSVFGAVFFAALIQSTTGIGFGLIAMPFLLIALTGSSAVQITIILSLGMSVMLCAGYCVDPDRHKYDVDCDRHW